MNKVALVVGWVLHVLVAGLMIFSGSGKVFGFAPQVEPDSPQMARLGELAKLIGGGELISAVALLVPWSTSLGVLLTSAFWGGTICWHMSRGEPYWMQSILLLMTWAGAFLRTPEMFSSFRR
jgi:hypothetical protein